MTRSVSLMAAFAMLAACRIATAEPGVVVTQDGQTIHGDLREDGDQVELTHGGKKHRYARASLKSVRTDREIDADYQQRARTAKADDLAAQVELLHWCDNQGSPAITLKQAQQVLRLKFDH